MIYRIGTCCPEIAAETFVADDAIIIGDVTLETSASVWFGAVIRADNDRIIVRTGANIQDGTVIHTDPGFEVEIGERATIGHRVMLHGCRIGRHSLIGINSVVLNGAVIGEDCLVGANSMVTANKTIPARSLVMGSPAKVVRELRDDEVESLRHAASHYIDKIPLYRDELVQLDKQ